MAADGSSITQNPILNDFVSNNITDNAYYTYSLNGDLCLDMTNATELEYKTFINKHRKKRKEMLNNLNNIQFTLSTYTYPNLDFLSKFNELMDNTPSAGCYCDFVIDPNNKFICDKFTSIEKGKAGDIFKRCANGTTYIVKKIPLGYSVPSFLPLHINNITKFKITDEYKTKYSPSIAYNTCIFESSINNVSFDGIISVDSNNFINQTCMHMIIDQIFNKHYKDSHLYQYDAFYCKNSLGTYDGWNITEYANQDTLSAFIEKNPELITDDMIKDILKQVIEPLMFLKCKKYGFVHGDLKCRNIFVTSIVDHGTTKYIFKLADFDKSSIFWKGIRFHTSNMISKTVPDQVYNILPDNTYVLSDRLSCKTIQKDTMFSWVPMLPSYDYYTFIYSLVREPVIYTKLKKELPTLLSIVLQMFEIDKISKEMDDFLQIYNTADTEKRKILAKNQRSIEKMNDKLCERKDKLKIDCDGIFKSTLNILTSADINNAIDDYHSKHPKKTYRLQLAGDNQFMEYNICINPCESHSCETNTYNITLQGDIKKDIC